MKINKYIWNNDEYFYYYEVGYERIWYGLTNDKKYYSIGYHYHNVRKGFWLKVNFGYED